MAVTAVQQIRRMRGGAQSHLMLGADDNLYVVKFQNNPQHLRVLANELLATRLAATAGLTVPVCEVIEVSEWLIAHTSELDMDMGRGRRECCAGLQFGSRFVGGLMPGFVVDYLEEDALLEVRNLHEFAGMLALDNGRAMPTGGKRYFRRGAERSGIWLHSSTRDIASTLGNGDLRMRRFEVFMRATRSIVT